MQPITAISSYSYSKTWAVMVPNPIIAVHDSNALHCERQEKFYDTHCALKTHARLKVIVDAQHTWFLSCSKGLRGCQLANKHWHSTPHCQSAAPETARQPIIRQQHQKWSVGTTEESLKKRYENFSKLDIFIRKYCRSFFTVVHVHTLERHFAKQMTSTKK